MPSPRGVQRRSIADALLAFEERLRAAADMAAAPGAAAGVDRAGLTAAIAEALARAERLRLDAPDLDYESLVAVLADLIEPLDAAEHLA